MVKKCTCKHTDQDKLHGKGNRVHNETGKTVGTRVVFRCTVCLTEREK